MSKFIVNSFQVPNAVHDEVMPHLGDAALRCYITIIRQTLGWQKTKDKISISQFMKKTGRSRHSVIRGVDELVKLGLIKKELVGSSNGKTAEYSVNLEISQCQFLTSAESAPVPKVHMTSAKSDTSPVPKVHTQKDTITKDTIINTLAQGGELEDIFNVGTKEDFSFNKNLALTILVEAFNVSPEEAEAYIEHRKKRKASITLSILRDYVKKVNLVNAALSKRQPAFEPLTVNDAINFMINRGYQGLFVDSFMSEIESQRKLEQQAQQQQEPEYNPFIGTAEEILYGDDTL